VREEGEGAEEGRHESKRKEYSGEYAKGWADWAGQGRRLEEEAGRHGERGRGKRDMPAGGWAKKVEWSAGLIREK
jgi:hypothetical protein